MYIPEGKHVCVVRVCVCVKHFITLILEVKQANCASVVCETSLLIDEGNRGICEEV